MDYMFENWPAFDIGEGAFYAVFGFIFVFVGIVVLILIFSLIGLIMKKWNARPKKQKAKKAKKENVANVPMPAPEQVERDGRIPPETVAVIAAAIAAYYEGNKSRCDFVVKRIKRL